MFTIKYTEGKREFTVECESCSYEEGSDGVDRLIGYDTPYATDDTYKCLFTGSRAPARGPGIKSAYVMNRYGATVAQYHWWHENHPLSPLHSAGPSAMSASAAPVIPVHN